MSCAVLCGGELCTVRALQNTYRLHIPCFFVFVLAPPLVGLCSLLLIGKELLCETAG